MTIMPFNYRDAQVRVITGDDKQPWFVAADVAAVLGYRDAAAFTRGLDDSEDRGTRIVCTPSGAQEMTVISEAGLYACLLHPAQATPQRHFTSRLRDRVPGCPARHHALPTMGSGRGPHHLTPTSRVS